VQNPQPFIVDIVQRPTPQTTIADVIIGSLGITGLLVLLSLVLGLVVAALLVTWHRRHPPEQDHLPPVSPFVRDPGPHPSSPTR
jgi:ABC-type phosphate transport system permease subunit